MSKLRLEQVDPTGVILNDVEMEFTPSEKNKIGVSRFYFKTDNQLIGMFKILKNEHGNFEIDFHENKKPT